MLFISSVGFTSAPLPPVDAVQVQNRLNQELTTASIGDCCVKNKAYREFLAWL
ncbi:hypothetical protein BDV12DRAFT_181309 [Aspergillus spectabilis]